MNENAQNATENAKTNERDIVYTSGSENINAWCMTFAHDAIADSDAWSCKRWMVKGMDEKKIKNIEKVDQALHLIRQRAMDCIISGKPATITCEIILVDGGGYRSAVVGVREKV